MKHGNLVISLDFELLWGVFDKVDWRERKLYFQNTRNIIPEILELFSQYEVSCTWATVGMLFNENWDEWNHNIPEYIPNYKTKSLSAYRYGKSIQKLETEEFCFAPQLIKLISNTSGQEIGSHTYCHYYCLEPGQTLYSFRADLHKSKQVAASMGLDLQALVFPRNQYNPDYLGACAEYGITSIRTNPDDWYWQDPEKNSLQQKIFRSADAYFGKKNKSYYIEEIDRNFGFDLKGQKASRFLRPHESNSFINKRKLNRIKDEMTSAAKQNKIYHLWWHPHNFGDEPQKSLEDLRSLLDHYQECRGRYNFDSVNMSSLNAQCEKEGNG